MERETGVEPATLSLEETNRCDQITGGGRPDAPVLESADPP